MEIIWELVLYKTSNKLEIEFWCIKTKFYKERRLAPCWNAHTWSTVSLWLDESKILRKVKWRCVKLWGKSFQDGIYKPSIFFFFLPESILLNVFLLCVLWMSPVLGVVGSVAQMQVWTDVLFWPLETVRLFFIQKLVCNKPNVTF